MKNSTPAGGPGPSSPGQGAASRPGLLGFVSGLRPRSISKAVVAASVFDWIAVLVIAAIGGAINQVHPYHRPFSLVDLSISYPYEPDLIPTWLLVVCGLVAPAAIILLVVLLFVPGPGMARRLGSRKAVIRKVWELNAGWIGLGLSLAMAFTITQGMKIMFSRPRPNLLARCNPDLDRLEDALEPDGSFAVGMPASWAYVSTAICRPRSRRFLDEGFKSFLSGHSSFSFAGLFYLTLFLCAKFSIFIPYLHPRAFQPHTFEDAVSVGTGRRRHGGLAALGDVDVERGAASHQHLHRGSYVDGVAGAGGAVSPDPGTAAQRHMSRGSVGRVGPGPVVVTSPSVTNVGAPSTPPPGGAPALGAPFGGPLTGAHSHFHPQPHHPHPRHQGHSRPIPLRNQAANPPTYLIIVAAIPTIAALYIASTRYVQYYHFGVDVLAGSLLGIGAAMLAFRWHHMPLGTGAGWAWGPRGTGCRFGIGVGAARYVDYGDDDDDDDVGPGVGGKSGPGGFGPGYGYGHGYATGTANPFAPGGTGWFEDTHPAFRDPRLERPVPPSPGRASIAQSTRNSVLHSGGGVGGSGAGTAPNAPGGEFAPMRRSGLSTATAPGQTAGPGLGLGSGVGGGVPGGTGVGAGAGTAAGGVSPGTSPRLGMGFGTGSGSTEQNRRSGLSEEDNSLKLG